MSRESFEINELGDLAFCYAFVTPIESDEPLYEGYIKFIDENVVVLHDLDSSFIVIKYKGIKILQPSIENEFYAPKAYQGIIHGNSFDKELNKKIVKALADYQNL